MQQRSRRQFVLGVAGATAAVACRESGHDPKLNETTAALQPAPGVPPEKTTGEVPQRMLGKTGVKVSMLGLGGFHIGQGLTEVEAVTLIRHAIDNGITFLDNCWDYNNGDSELRMGKALANGYRQRAFLMTKIDGRTREAAAAQLDQSLARLSTDVIDLVQIHEVIRMDDPERCFREDGTIHALIAAKQAGKLRFIGFTGHKDPQIHLAMLKLAEQHGFAFDTVQMPLNVMDAHFRSFEREVLPVLVDKQIGVLGMKSMGSGDVLSSGVVSPEECLRYALSLPTSVVICGMDSRKVLDANVETVRNFKPLDEAERQALLARTAAPAATGEHEPFKTSTKYDGTVKSPHWLEEARL
jgi:aryl-alcohol dehydrogenase-like predicted oxidoreductase